MKQNCLLWMLVGMLLAGCGEITPEIVDETPQPIVLTKSQEAVMLQGNDFAFKLLRECHSEFKGDNLFLSPMGVTIVSSMLANGAEGKTYEEALAILAGVTLESLVVSRRVYKAVVKKAELGQLNLSDFPLLCHVADVLDNGKDAELPWDAFTFDKTA